MECLLTDLILIGAAVASYSELQDKMQYQNLRHKKSLKNEALKNKIFGRKERKSQKFTLNK